MGLPHGLGRWVPGLALLRRRRGAELRRDVVAGVVLAALLVRKEWHTRPVPKNTTCRHRRSRRS